MEALLKDVLWALVKIAGLMVLVCIPVFLFAWLLGRRKKRYRQAGTAPFTDQLSRPPGESLRIKIQELDDKLTEELLILVMFPLVLAAVTVASRDIPSWPSLITVILIVGLFVLWRGRRSIVTSRTLLNYRLGFDGERVVGEALNQLMLDGYRVFHDVPFDGFNIDHVVVGESGVYSIETKTRRKPKDERGRKTQWTVEYDGRALNWPKGLDTYGLEQASNNARTLSNWLSTPPGDRVAAYPVLILPGWFVERKGKGEVVVLNEKEVRSALVLPVKASLPSEQIQRIVHQLTEKCRLPADSKI